MENWDWASDVKNMLSEDLSKDIKKEIEEYIDSFVVECDGEEIDTKELMMSYIKPSFSIRAERALMPPMYRNAPFLHTIVNASIADKYLDTWTHRFAEYMYSLAYVLPDNKYQSYHKPPQNEFVISKNLENKFAEWRKK